MRILISLLFLAFLTQSISVSAQSSKVPLHQFSALPILVDGRVQPMENYARNTYEYFANKEGYSSKKALSWFAETLFDPASSIELPIIHVKNADVRAALDLKDNASQLFTYKELTENLSNTHTVFSQAFSKLNTQDPLSAKESEIIAVHEKLFLYTQLMRSFSFTLPLDLGNGTPIIFKDLLAQRASLQKRLENIISEKGSDFEAYSPDEQKVALLLSQMKTVQDAGAEQDSFKVIPVSGVVDEKGSWVSPWAIYTQGAGTPQTAALMQAWSTAVAAYREGNKDKWNAALSTIASETYALADKPFLQAKINIERINKAYSPIVIAFALCLLALLCFIIQALKPFTILTILGVVSGWVALGLQFIALGVRVLILERPPVGTLNESILFVALVAGLIGLAFAKKTGKDNLLILGVFVNAILLFVAIILGAHTELPLLDAVLNTNFWLAIHVLCITIGYAWCLLASAASQYLLYINPVEARRSFSGIPRLFVIVSLLFVSVGTALGGIWADQSWGRFWGWDPKENGALLIVLWIIWLTHGLLSGHIKPFGAHLMTGFLSIVVALAWFGVNLLSVGLHAYGFVSGIAGGLFGFVTLQTGLLIYLSLRGREK